MDRTSYCVQALGCQTYIFRHIASLLTSPLHYQSFPLDACISFPSISSFSTHIFLLSQKEMRLWKNSLDDLLIWRSTDSWTRLRFPPSTCEGIHSGFQALLPTPLSGNRNNVLCPRLQVCQCIGSPVLGHSDFWRNSRGWCKGNPVVVNGATGLGPDEGDGGLWGGRHHEVSGTVKFCGST